MRKIKRWLNSLRESHDHTLLAIAICLPCLLITTTALIIANVSGYLIAFIILILTLIATFIVVSSQQRAEQQVRTLANIIGSMIDGDYSLRGRVHQNKAFQELLLLVNNLAETLSRHKVEAKESRLLLDKIMQQMDAMVFATDEQGRVVIANDSAQKLLINKSTMSKNSTTNNKLSEKVNIKKLRFGQQICQADTGIIEFNLATEPLLPANSLEQNSLISELRGEHFLFKDSFYSEGKLHQLYLITAAERLLIEKERQAWQSLLRVLSHEMNNSLTPISTISQSILSKLANSEQQIDTHKLSDGISIINERSSSLSSFIASYSQLSHLPTPNKTSIPFLELIERNIALFPKCQLVIAAGSADISQIYIQADRQQFEQVLINLLKNADEAMIENEHKIIELSYQITSKNIVITLCDNGKGIANINNLFVPFYTTKTQGSGIGLTLCKQIMFNHGGNIALQNKSQNSVASSSGAEVILTLPKP